MKIEGSRIVGGLTLWLGAGFAADALLAPTLHEILLDAGLEPGAAPSLGLRVGLVAFGAALALLGLVLLVRAPGEPAIGADELAAERDRAPRRCWRCREPWPPDADACPACGAERLR